MSFSHLFYAVIVVSSLQNIQNTQVDQTTRNYYTFQRARSPLAFKSLGYIETYILCFVPNTAIIYARVLTEARIFVSACLKLLLELTKIRPYRCNAFC